MDIRVEAFNLFNRVVWGAPNTELQQQQLRRDLHPGQLRPGRCSWA